MTDYSSLTIGELLQGIHETREELKRADEFLTKVSDLGVKTPSSVTRALAESTAKLKAHLEEDLEALAQAIIEAEKG